MRQNGISGESSHCPFLLVNNNIDDIGKFRELCRGNHVFVDRVAVQNTGAAEGRVNKAAAMVA